MNKKVKLLSAGNRFFYIDNDGRDFELTKAEAVIKVCEGFFVVKVEGLESVHKWGKSVHAFISPAGSASFDTHIDDVNLVIASIEGTKVFEVYGETVEINETSSLYVSAGSPHRGVNRYDSITLSIEV
jgi:mannose-6-phosphate isomerase-like protein (cupin superfamily)